MKKKSEMYRLLKEKCKYSPSLVKHNVLPRKDYVV